MTFSRWRVYTGLLLTPDKEVDVELLPGLPETDKSGAFTYTAF